MASSSLWTRLFITLALGFIFVCTPGGYQGISASGDRDPVLLSAAAGENHTVALEADGTIWAWGSNYSGQLGNGQRTAEKSPVKISDITGVASIAAGSEVTLAAKEDGTAWAWGNNEYGQVGDGTQQNRYAPVKVRGIEDVSGVSVGSTHSMALLKDGTVWAWGRGYYGQLGDGTESLTKTTPVKVREIGGIRAISAGGKHSLALDGNGTVWAWGNNEYGQLGIEKIDSSNTPVRVPVSGRVAGIAAGYLFSAALRDDGTVWVWGYNEGGELGIGSAGNKFNPVKLDTVSDVKMIAAGAYHLLLLKNDGSLWACGSNKDGQMGNGSSDTAKMPVLIEGLPKITRISTNRYHSLALAADGSLWTWGSNIDGQLGSGVRDNTWRPRRVLPLEPSVNQAKPAIQAEPATEPEPAEPKSAESGTVAQGSATPGPDKSGIVVQGSATPGFDKSASAKTELASPAVKETLRERLVLVPMDASGKVEGTKYIYDGKVLLDSKSGDIEWACISPDHNMIAYKVGPDICLFDVMSKKSSIVYKMTSDEYVGKWVYNYGFLPGYWYKFVGWLEDSKGFVVDKNYPGLFKGGCGYYRIWADTGKMEFIAQDDVLVK